VSYVARRVLGSLLIATSLLLTLWFFEPSASAQIKLSVFVDPHPVVSGGTIGFAFAGNKFVGSVQGDGAGILYMTDQSGSNVQLFAPNVVVRGGNPFSEHYVASSPGLAGFPRRDIYVAAGNGVLHISNDGSHSDMLVDGLSGPVDAILFDSVGTFGRQMLVSTEEGRVYRIDSAGTPSFIASVGIRSEAMDIAPVGAGFGPYDGHLIVISEYEGLLRAISNAGTVSVLNPNNPIPDVESLRFVPLDLGASGSPLEGLYTANFPPNILKADASQFTAFKGDAILRTEQLDQRISRVHWNGHSFEITIIGYAPGQGEDALFLTPSMIDPGNPGCEDSTGAGKSTGDGDHAGRRPLPSRHTPGLNL
jgi:hypothetical protein